MGTRFNAEVNFHAKRRAPEGQSSARSLHRAGRERAAVWQARLIMLVMINVAQLWILSATVEAALASHYSMLLPLVISSGVCFLITLSILLWWRPVSGKHTSTGYIRASSKD